jgi:Lipopolysaccharide biosynthesis proteins, LPS:glycosyltransferases
MKAALTQLGLNRAEITYINLHGKLRDIDIDERYTVAAFYRLLLPDLLPDYNKVIYIDCDVVVRNDLAKLYWETDLNGYYLGAVFEATLDSQMDYLNQLGIKAGQYINSGFLLINLKKMRFNGMVEKMLQAAKKPNLHFPDQDVINQLCQGKILGLPPYYNSIRTFYLPQYQHVFLRYYTNMDWKAVHKYGNVHYTGSKPWNSFTVQLAVWWQYYEQLPECIKSQWQKNNKIWLLYRIYNQKSGKFLIDLIQHVYRRLKYKTGI